MQKFVITVLLGLMLGGCHTVFEVPRDQGNVLDQHKINQVRPGMTKDQVSYLLGNPVLENTFNDNLWDYVFTHESGYLIEKHHVSVYFRNGKVVNLEQF